MNRKGFIICCLTVAIIFIAFLTQEWIFQNFTYEEYVAKATNFVSGKEQLLKHIDHKKATIGHDQFKFDNPNAYADYHWGIRTKLSESGPGYKAGEVYKELVEAKKNRFYRNANALRVSDLEFTERGPANVPGRTRALVVLPQDESKNTWLAGGVGGGIWKTTDAGDTWELKTPNIPSMAISWMSLCQSQPNIVYAATGEAIGGGRGILGDGVLKSVDGGETWEVLSSTLNNEDFSFIGRIIVDYDNPDVVLICSTQGQWDREFQSGIYKSIDGGLTWNQVYKSDAWISQIVADPATFNTIYAAKWGRGVLKSIDQGETWLESSHGFKDVTGRLELAISITNSDWIYASAQGNNTGSGSDLYVSTDAGIYWSIVDQKYKDESVDFLRGQGDYDNTIAVNPFDHKEVYYGGVNLWKTTIRETEPESAIPIISMTVANDSLSIWDFINFGAQYFNGKLEINEELENTKFVDVEVRTGSGISQFAHRFTVDELGSGVPDSGYYYQDYVEVPFEVWDVNSNRQLMISFRDQQDDGAFNLIYQITESANTSEHSREYIFIHALEYGNEPNVNIAQRGGDNTGQKYEQMYFFWPVLNAEQIWNPKNLDSDTIDIEFDIVYKKQLTSELIPVSDAYGDFVDNLNPAYNQSSTEFDFHPDHHNLIMIPMNIDNRTYKILNANDGGVFISNVSTNPGIKNGDWTSRGSGFNTGQFYSAAKKPGAEIYIGGLQDNGTWKSPDDIAAKLSTKYESVWGGDGFDVLWNYLNTNKYIVSTYNNNFYLTENNGNTWLDIGDGIGGRYKPFFSKLASSHSTPDVIYTVSSDGVHKSTDFGKKWIETSIDDNWGFSDFIEIKVSLANPKIVWAGSGMSDGMSIHVSTDGGDTFFKTKNFTDSELGYISGLATHPSQDSTAYALFSFSNGPKILRTKNLGTTWEDISGFYNEQRSSNGFPDVAVYCLLVRPDDSEILWAGTEIGIFKSLDNGVTWSFLENKMGATAVWDMNVMDDEIVIATHGRGIFTAKLSEQVEVTVAPEIENAGMSVKGTFNIKASLRSSYDSTILHIGNDHVSVLSESDIGDIVINVSSFEEIDSTVIYFTSYRDNIPYESKRKIVTLFEVSKSISEYKNDFENSSDDFIGYGFDIRGYDGFNDVSIHSLHPYQEGVNFEGGQFDYFYYLKSPVIVDELDAYMHYDNIALIEPGEAGVEFPDDEFYDFVVFEGSKNGYDWTSLADGYDANKISSWKNAYDGNINIGQYLMRTMEIDLLDSYAPGDTILLRLRLHSDPLTVGWGWAIDNVRIQSVITSVSKSELQNPQVLIYPNPATDKLNIKILKGSQFSNLNIYQANGQVLKSFALNESNLETHIVDVSELSTGIYVLKLSGKQREHFSKLIIK